MKKEILEWKEAMLEAIRNEDTEKVHELWYDEKYNVEI